MRLPRISKLERIARMRFPILDQRTGLRSTLELTDEQMQLASELRWHNRVIVLKGRQIGASTMCCAWDAMLALLNPGLSVAIVADTADKAQRMLGLCRSFLQSIDVPLSVDNVKSIQLFNGATIDAISAVSRAADGESRVGRSRSYGAIHCSEMAFWADDASTFAALMSTALPTARVYIESTATGSDTLFRRIWADGPGWRHRFFSVEDHDVYQSDERTISDSDWHTMQERFGFSERRSAAWWLRHMRTEMAGDEIRMLREYPIKPEHAFLSARGRWIRQTTDATLLSSLGGWDVYGEPVGATVIGVDTATGAAQDASALGVMDRVTGKLVATYRRKDVSIPEFVRELQTACTRYHPEAVVVESNGVGAAVYQSMLESRVPVYEQVSSAVNGEKYVRLSLARYLIESGSIPVAGDLKYECEHAIIDDNGKYKGADDVLNAISFAAVWIRDNPHRPMQPKPDPREVFVPKHKQRAKQVLF